MSHGWKMAHTWKNKCIAFGKWVIPKKCVTVRIIGLFSKNVSQLQKMGHTWKCLTVGKWVTPKKNVSQLVKCVALKKMCHTWKNGSHLKECVTIGKMGRTWKNVSQLENWVTLNKMCHKWKNESHLKKICDCYWNGSHLKIVPVGKIGHS